MKKYTKEEIEKKARVAALRDRFDLTKLPMDFVEDVESEDVDVLLDTAAEKLINMDSIDAGRILGRYGIFCPSQGFEIACRNAEFLIRESLKNGWIQITDGEVDTTPPKLPISLCLNEIKQHHSRINHHEYLQNKVDQLQKKIDQSQKKIDQSQKIIDRRVAKKDRSFQKQGECCTQ